MTGGIRIARLFGIDISVHPSWFIILLLIVWSLGAGTFPAIYDGWSQFAYWSVAVAAALLLFVSVLLHELAHSLVALRQGTPVKGITLFFLGGVANIGREPAGPGREALMAAAGPLTSIALGGGFLAAGQAVAGPEVLRAVLLYLGFINLALAAFNLLPGFPLDGGRILRAAIWAVRGDLVKATRDASRVGLVIGVALIGYGAYTVLTGGLLGGLWLAFIGWILIQAGRASYAQTVTQQRLAGVPMRRVMAHLRGWISPVETLEHARQGFRDAQTRCLPVGTDGEHYDGLMCLTDLQARDATHPGPDTVRDVMVDRRHMESVEVSEPASEAWLRLADGHVDRLAVTDHGVLVGFVDRRRLERYLQLHRPDDAPPRAA